MNIELLERVSNIAGIPGFEHEAQELVAEELRPYADTIRVDRMGNVIALRRARKPTREKPFRLLYSAHVDEIGFMVTHIDDEGFISARRMMIAECGNICASTTSDISAVRINNVRRAKL